MRTIYLYGHLAKMVGQESVDLQVSTIQEIGSALRSANEEVYSELLNNNWMIFTGPDIENLTSIDSVAGTMMQLRDGDNVWIVPEVDGEGFLAAIGSVFGGVLSGAAFGGGILGTIAAFALKSLLFYGLSSLLAPTPKAAENGSSNNSADENPSFLFNGAINVTEQGGSIPLVYGRARCGSIVIGTALYTEVT